MLERSTAKYVLALWLSDLFTTALSLNLAGRLRVLLPLGKPLKLIGGTPNQLVLFMILLIWTGIFLAFSVYNPHRILRVTEELQRVLFAIVLAVLALAGILFFSFRGVSRLLVAYFLAVDLLLVPVGRILVRYAFKLLRRRRVSLRRILILGTGEVAQRVAAALEEYRWAGLEIVGFLGDQVQSGTVEGYPVIGTIENAAAIIEETNADEVIIALPLDAYPAVPEIVGRLQTLPVNVKIVPDFLPLAFFRTSMENLGDVPLLGLKEPMIQGFPRRVKRAIDIVLSSILLILFAPWCLLIALLIRLDSPGPVMFNQERVGENGQRFWMYKFRTMVDNAAPVVGENGTFVKQPNDPRVTRVGRLLRRLSLDEIPQLVNVLRGDMSMVGPRPELPFLVDRYELWQRKRFSVPQGMTGWWQVNGRSDRPMHMHTEDDLFYIQNYSIFLDFQILWKTIWVVLRGKGAY